MEWISALYGTLVALDTAPLIYFIEENPAYLKFVRPFFEAVDRGEILTVTSVLTVTEVLVHPMRQGDQELATQYRRILLQRRTSAPFQSRSQLQSARRNYVLGTDCELQLGNPLRASEDCRKALKYDNKDAVAYWQMGYVYITLFNRTKSRNELTTARENFVRMLEINPNLDKSRLAKDYIEQISVLLPKTAK